VAFAGCSQSGALNAARGIRGNAKQKTIATRCRSGKGRRALFDPRKRNEGAEASRPEREKNPRKVARLLVPRKRKITDDFFFEQYSLGISQKNNPQAFFVCPSCAASDGKSPEREKNPRKVARRLVPRKRKITDDFFFEQYSLGISQKINPQAFFVCPWCAASDGKSPEREKTPRKVARLLVPREEKNHRRFFFFWSNTVEISQKNNPQAFFVCRASDGKISSAATNSALLTWEPSPAINST
jgi:hypothetical protein